MKKLTCFLLVLLLSVSAPFAMADIVLPGVDGGAPTVIATPGDDGPIIPKSDETSAKPGWTPTFFDDADINTVSTLSMKTEHKVYKPGADSICIIMKNTRKKTFTYGHSLGFYLERKTQSGWQHYFDPARVIPMSGYEIPARSSGTTTLDIAANGLPPLAEGEYRIIMNGLHYGSPLTEGTFAASASFKVAQNGYDPAYLSGYTPLEQLPTAYSVQDAIKDGVLFAAEDGTLHNKQKLLEFLERTFSSAPLPAKIRILRLNELGEPLITDVSRDTHGRFALKQDRTRTSETEKWANTAYERMFVRRVDGKDAIIIENTSDEAIGEWTLLHDIAPAGSSKVKAYLKAR